MKSAGPSLTPFEAKNLNRLKVSKFGPSGIPCCICTLNWIYTNLKLIKHNMTYIMVICYQVRLLTWLNPWSFASSNRDSWLITNMLSNESPLHRKFQRTWLVTIIQTGYYLSQDLINFINLDVTGKPSRSLLIERPPSFLKWKCCIIDCVNELSNYFSTQQRWTITSIIRGR